MFLHSSKLVRLLAVCLCPLGPLASVADESDVDSDEWEVTIRAVGKDKGGAEGQGTEGVSNERPEATLRFRAEVMAFGDGGIRFKPAIAPGQEMEFKVDRLVSISRISPKIKTSPPVKKPDAEVDPAETQPPVTYTVFLADGGDFGGRLVSLTPEKAVLESDLLGRLEIPTGAINSISRDNDKGLFLEPPLADSELETTVMLDSGEVLRGQLDPGEAEAADKLALTSPIAEATFSVTSIGRIDFPQRNVTEEADGALEYEISLEGGGQIVCKRVEMGGTGFGMALRSGIELDLPKDRVESIHPVKHTGSVLGSGVLMWGGFSDVDEEYEHTKEVVEKGGNKIDEIMEQIPGQDFRRRLFRARAFVVPELEGFSDAKLNEEFDHAGGKMKLGDYLSTVMRQDLDRYLSAGGHVIFAGVQNQHKGFLKALNVEDVAIAAGRDGSELEIPAEAQRKLRLTREKLTAANATFSYNVPEGWDAWAGSPGKSGLVISKRFKRGRVTLFGADFYETNESLDEFFQNAIRFGN